MGNKPAALYDGGRYPARAYVSTRAPSPRPPPIATGMPDDRPPSPRDWLSHAPVTRALLFLNAAVFVVEVARSHHVMDLPPKDALALGANYGLATIGESRWETLVTACFLHAGIIHLGFNMLALWQAGPLVERAVGSARMAPMYLVAGAFGNLLSVGYGWLARSGSFSVGASGAISGVIAAALIVGWRVSGWRGPLTQAMARWLGFVVLFGILSNASGGRIDNAAHIGGALAGAVIAAMWRRGQRYSAGATAAILAICVSVLVACIAVVAYHDRTDPFATMILEERSESVERALRQGGCRDAHIALAAVDRLRDPVGPETSLRDRVEGLCDRPNR
ncbi:MAG TPA: rhomboid family intramembrane serine protease [Polyangiaceae bacterium]|nr:rhomboid family intramembrane serine protease [Polyangiaceae bacterium]